MRYLLIVAIVLGITTTGVLAMEIDQSGYITNDKGETIGRIISHQEALEMYGVVIVNGNIANNYISKDEYSIKIP